MELGLAGNTALVTGSSAGLGKAAARALAREGANVVVNGRDENRLSSTVSDLESVGDGSVLGRAADISNEPEAGALVEDTVAEFGRLDYLVVSAGGPPEGLLDIPNEELYDAFDRLAMSFVFLLRAAETPLRADPGGAVVSIESISVKETLESVGMGSTVRMSNIAIAKIMARELGPAVRVNTVLPGLFETDRFREHVEAKTAEGTFDSYEDGVRQYAAAADLDRVGDAADMGNAIAFLCSDWARHITGVALPVDGGVTRSNL